MIPGSLAACTSYGVTPQFALGPDQVAGSPEVHGFLDGADRDDDDTDPVTACDGLLGFSVSSATFGDGVDQTRFVARLVGCPGEATDRGGFVAQTARSSESARDPITMGYYDEVILMEGAFNLGWSILGADVIDCHGPVSGAGCGDEVLVGAPNVAGPGKGRVRWFTIDDGGVAAPKIVHRGDITAPSSFAGGALFGSALAAPHELADPDAPWDDVPYDTRWVAVGAPGASSVAVYTVDRTSSSPFTLDRVLSGTGDFGAALVTGRFDEDAFIDLAVAMPRSDDPTAAGRVYVYLARSADGDFVATPDLVLTPADMTGVAITTPTEEFGFALAAGPLSLAVNHDALVVGVPGHDGEVGLVCQVVLHTEPTTTVFGVLETVCDDHRLDHRAAPGDRFGHALVVGNVVNSDDRGNQHDPAATFAPLAAHPEVVVGAPGWSHPVRHPGEGRIYVVPTNDAGLVADERYPDLANPVQKDPDEAFGAALHPYVIQETHWTDLLIGIPGMSPTAASSWGGYAETQADGYDDCTDGSGVRTPEVFAEWSVADSTGTTRRLRIWEDGAGFTNITFLEPFEVHLHDGGTTSDPRCTYTDDDGVLRDSIIVPADTHMPLADAWTCTGGTAGTYTFSTVPAEPVIAAWSLASRGVAESPTGHKVVLTMAYDPRGSSRTDDEVELTFDVSDLPLDDLGLDEDCNIPGPLVGSWADRVTE